MGTNNHGHTAEQVTDGIMSIVKAIQDRQKDAQLIVMVRYQYCGTVNSYGKMSILWHS